MKARTGIDWEKSGNVARLLPMDSESELAVVRYDGDPDVFTALAWAHCIDNDYDWTIQPPEPRLYRVNPDCTHEYPWLLAQADKRGPGVWLGAIVRGAVYRQPAWMRELLTTDSGSKP